MSEEESFFSFDKSNRLKRNQIDDNIEYNIGYDKSKCDNDDRFMDNDSNPRIVDWKSLNQNKSTRHYKHSNCEDKTAKLSNAKLLTNAENNSIEQQLELKLSNLEIDISNMKKMIDSIENQTKSNMDDHKQNESCLNTWKSSPNDILFPIETNNNNANDINFKFTRIQNSISFTHKVNVTQMTDELEMKSKNNTLPIKEIIKQTQLILLLHISSLQDQFLEIIQKIISYKNNLIDYQSKQIYSSSNDSVDENIKINLDDDYHLLKNNLSNIINDLNLFNFILDEIEKDIDKSSKDLIKFTETMLEQNVKNDKKESKNPCICEFTKYVDTSIMKSWQSTLINIFSTMPNTYKFNYNNKNNASNTKNKETINNIKYLFAPLIYILGYNSNNESFVPDSSNRIKENQETDSIVPIDNTNPFFKLDDYIEQKESEDLKELELRINKETKQLTNKWNSGLSYL